MQRIRDSGNVAQHGIDELAVIEVEGEGPLRWLKGQHKLKGQLDDFKIGVDRFAAEDIGVQLPKFAVAAPLGLFVAPKVGDAKKAQRFGSLAVEAGHHAGDGGGHFGANGQLPAGMVGDDQQLFAPDILARFSPVDVGQFEDGGEVFFVAKLAVDPPPGVEDVLADGKFWRQPVAGASDGVIREF